MKKLIGLAKEFGAPALMLALPVLVSAQAQPPITPPSTITNVTQLAGTSGSLLCTIVNWVFYLLIVLTIIFVLVAAFKYLTAAGDPEKVKSAGSTLLYAAIAVVVALIAKGLPLIVSSFIGGGLGTTAC